MAGKKTKALIGDVYINKYGDKFEIVGYDDSSRHYRFVKFDDGTIQRECVKRIKDGCNIYNKNTTPTVFGVGINDVGDSCHILYQRWVNMIGRCYSKKHCQYNSYGAKGVIVEDYLLRFSNYVNFISSLKNYDLLVDNPQNYQIDKDIKCGRQSIYSRETISIVKKEDNLEEENKGKRVAIARYTLDDEFIDEFESIYKASKATNISIGNIARCVRKEIKTAGGYKWVSLTNNK